MAITSDIRAVISTFQAEYSKTPTKLKAIDLFLVYSIATAVLQFLYMSLVGSFPFNAFLAGLLCCIGTSVLAVCLRMQANPDNKEFKDLPPERAFADYVLCSLVLYLVVINFIG
eukprot:TRINITY_DN36081_c0_g1_i1.p1 TRINITY_DN36081_c0_g1~~TRINITY_DN36081_c0_g1_i1.p1  ORF type:complete len:114 (-),score=19.30 TRINITY_DN36081_c0_g1_i1:625-966(-)